MSWECHAREADDCVIEDLYDPTYTDGEGNPLCVYCAVTLGLLDPGYPVTL